MLKRPSFQFYPSDWRTDPGLRLCSVGARGLWIEMICLMHEGEPYGHLTAFGEPLSNEDLSRLAGEPIKQIEAWLKELFSKKVYTISAEGAIFSRRMLRDETQREARATVGKDNGAKGGASGGLGAEYGAKGGRPRKANPGKQGDNNPPKNPPKNPPSNEAENPPSEPGQKPPYNPPSSSSSSSPSPFKSSVAKATAEIGFEQPAFSIVKNAELSPEEMLAKEVFDKCVTFLGGYGYKQERARNLAGKWRKAGGYRKVLEVVTEAMDQRPPLSEPVAWIEARLTHEQQAFNALCAHADQVAL
jgi:hypothetical protein